MTTLQGGADVPEGWREIYRNTLEGPAQVEGFRMEGEGAVTFPQRRLRLESTRGAEEGQKANVVFWCSEVLPAELAISWRFRPLREPGWPFCSSRLPVQEARIFSTRPCRSARANMTSTTMGRWMPIISRIFAGCGRRSGLFTPVICAKAMASTLSPKALTRCRIPPI